MNQNFVGQPNAEDIKALENLRRGLIPMLATLDKLKYDMDIALQRGTTVDWPQIQRATTSVNSYITNLLTAINGGRKYALESRKIDAGKILKNKQADQGRDYRDIDIKPQATTIRNLHPFPTSPLPGTHPTFSVIAQGLLRKRLEPTEEKWVEERLSKALEFADVPPAWGIEPRKGAVADDKNDNPESGSEPPSTAVGRFSKRAKGTLNEEQLVQRWNEAHMWFFNPPRTDFDDEGESEEGEEGEDDDDDDEAEFEDAMIPSAAEAGAVQPRGGDQPRKASSPVFIVQGVKPPVHEAVSMMPALDLGEVQRFMATGRM